MKYSNNYEYQSKNKSLKCIKENVPFSKQDKLNLEIHKSVKVISKKDSYNKKSNSILAENKIKSDNKLNKTLNNVKSNENINKIITSNDLKKKEKNKTKAKIINNDNKENEDKNINTETTKNFIRSSRLLRKNVIPFQSKEIENNKLCKNSLVKEI